MIRVRNPVGASEFLFVSFVQTSIQSIQPPEHCVPGFFPGKWEGVKPPEYGVDHYSKKVKNY
jgi:hypothetical protein